MDRLNGTHIVHLALELPISHLSPADLACALFSGRGLCIPRARSGNRYRIAFPPPHTRHCSTFPSSCTSKPGARTYCLFLCPCFSPLALNLGAWPGRHDISYLSRATPGDPILHNPQPLLR